jgi:hypothetical protein
MRRKTSHVPFTKPMDGRLSLILVKISIAGKSVASEKAVSGKKTQKPGLEYRKTKPPNF